MSLLYNKTISPPSPIKLPTSQFLPFFVHSTFSAILCQFQAIKNAHRGWNFVRMALLWARKGGIFNRRLIVDHLRLVPKFMKTLGHPTQPRHLPYGERQLSFNDTPVFRLKMHHLGSARFHLPHIPCINRPVDSDQECTLLDCDNQVYSCEVLRICDDAEDGINARADEFIAKFYEQLKLQRQTSYLQCDEMHCRGKIQ